MPCSAFTFSGQSLSDEPSHGKTGRSPWTAPPGRVSQFVSLSTMLWPRDTCGSALPEPTASPQVHGRVAGHPGWHWAWHGTGILTAPGWTTDCSHLPDTRLLPGGPDWAGGREPAQAGRGGTLAAEDVLEVRLGCHVFTTCGLEPEPPRVHRWRTRPRRPPADRRRAGRGVRRARSGYDR